jgi:hypothetical protein
MIVAVLGRSLASPLAISDFFRHSPKNWSIFGTLRSKIWGILTNSVDNGHTYILLLKQTKFNGQNITWGYS